MMKFFRKHNKKLLAIFGVLLMIVFVGGSALDNLLQPKTNRVVATSHVGDISYANHRAAEASTRILSAIGANWRRPFSGTTEPLDTLEWILLTREAKNLGMQVNPETLRSSFGGESGLNALARRLRIRPDHILHAMAEFSAIHRTTLAIGEANRPGEAEVRKAARDALEKVEIAAVLLPAEAFVDKEQEFTEEQIEAQFLAYRDREGRSGLEFGYYVQPTVQLQYTKIDKAAIEEKVRVVKNAYLKKKAKTYYDEQREQDRAFLRPPEETTTPDGEPIEGPMPPPYMEWDEASDIAMDIVCKDEAAQAAGRIANSLVQRLSEHWVGAVIGENGYKVAPDAVAKLEHYDEAIKCIPRTIAFPEAVSVATTDFFNEDGVGDVPVIGKASFRPERGGTTQWLRQLAFRSQAIVPVFPRERDVTSSDYLADFQTCRYPLSDADGNLYVFRIVDSREGHIPESIDEVRVRVLADLRLLHGFEIAKARAESLRSCATDAVSLQDAYESDDELLALKDTEAGANLGYFEPPPFTRMSRYDAIEGKRPERMYVGGGIGPVATEFVDRCFGLEEAYEKVGLFELRKRATVAVVAWVDTLRAQDEEFADMRESFVQQMVRSRSRNAIIDWLNPEQIQARNGFKIVEN